MNRARILQSGFLAWPTSDLVRCTAPEVSYKSAMYTPDYQVIDTENYYDKNIEFLFQQFRKDNSVVTKFEFREAVILSVFRVFREASVIPWLKLQLSQSSLSFLHRKFLTEMFASALWNKPKTLDNYQYYRLLKPTFTNPSTSLDQREAEGILKELLSSDGGNIFSSTVRLVTEWTGDLDGLIDMLCSMHVIFGLQSGMVSAASKSE